MWTMEELMELKTPFLAMQDITKKDWEMRHFYYGMILDVDIWFLTYQIVLIVVDS